MFQRVSMGHRGREEGEKPFWISFADLMTALMVLFLLVMSVALLAVTRTITQRDQLEAERQAEIVKLLNRIDKAAKKQGIRVDRNRKVIDFGDRARFDSASNSLSPEQERLLRSFVPEVLAIARDKGGQRWLKRIVVEGFTDRRGSYLYNLNLSLQRSQRVLCALMARPQGGERPMDRRELEEIRRLFLVGGYSSNSAKASLDASRRIELRLEFFGVDEPTSVPVNAFEGEFGTCAL
ncbi:OmpA family protein [Novosphingobium sp. BW1]|uniref:OmpA/MotB family protein n=1 Tax=Novosphingobium sp. BW1 TaxID=2592621 RepID=UPI0011DEF3CE|nr:OmpA family protein [Novosphingobium sp. BW1]TYC83808.1 OmpA family protein [Novosphingobium sp. BW1]